MSTLAVAALLIVLCVGALTAVQRPAAIDDTGLPPTPGLRKGDQSLDTTPFALARPDSRSGTTLPFNNGTLATTTSAPPTTTTTTTPLLAPEGDPVCQGALTLGEMARVSAEFSDDIPRVRAFVADEMRKAATTFADAGSTYATIAKLLDERASLVEATQTKQDIIDLALPIIDLTDPVIQPILGELKTHLAQTCPLLSP